VSDVTEKIIGYAGDCCVRASAGTGKTYLLVERFIRLLKTKNGEGRLLDPENILALTFSEKGAEEMRRRITARITEEIKKINADPDEKEAGKTAKHFLYSRRRISQAYISTIHSFCARVLREHPIEAGIDPHFEILDAPRSAALQKKALEQFLLAGLRSRDTAILHLAYRYGFDSGFRYDNSLVKIIESLRPLIRAAGISDSKELLSEYRKTLNGVAEKLSFLKTAALGSLAFLETAATTDKRMDKFSRLKKDMPSLNPKTDHRSGTAVSLLNRLVDDTKNWRLKGEANLQLNAVKTMLEDYRGLIVSSLAVESAEQICDLLYRFHRYMETDVKGKGRLDFDDLQEITVRLFRRNRAVKEHYRGIFSHVLVDEYQDLNGIQKKILDQLAPAGEGRLFIVGDAKQAIYGFRGGDFRLFEDAAGEIEKGGGKIFHIGVNRRANAGLIDFTNRLFGKDHGKIFKPEDASEPLRSPSAVPPIERISIDAEDMKADDCRYAEADLIASRIRGIIGEGMEIEENGRTRPARFGDVAILFRKFTILPIYESALNRAGIRHVIHKGEGFYQSQEVAELISLLLYLDNPSDTVSWVATVRSPYCGCSDETLFKLRKRPDGRIMEPAEYLLKPEAPPDVTNEMERRKFAEFMEWFIPLANTKNRMNVAEIIETVLEKSRISGILGAQPDGLQKVANVLKFIETARMMERESGITLKNFVRRVSALYESEAREPQALIASEEPRAVKIMTIHQSKGLEFPIVFLADVDSGVAAFRDSVAFNSRRGIAVRHVDTASLETCEGRVFQKIKQANAEKSTADASRLFYVACTRARDRLVISGAGMKRGSSGFAGQVDEIQSEYPELFYDPPTCAAVPDAEKDEKCAYDILSQTPETYDKKRPPAVERVSEKRAETGRKLFFSVSSIAAFARCPHEYFFGRLCRIEPAGKTAGSPDKKGLNNIETGKAVHAALERADFASDKKSYLACVEEGLARRLPGADKRLRKQISRELLALRALPLFAKLRAGGLMEVGREIPFTARLGSPPIFIDGKIDLLLKDEARIPTIVDYKYSAGTDNASARFQLELYALAVSGELPAERIRCALVYLKNRKPLTVEWELDESALSAVESRVNGIVAEIVRLEETARTVHGTMDGEKTVADLLPKGKCPNPYCGFAEFCNA